jgi:hypothetical protein
MKQRMHGSRIVSLLLACATAALAVACSVQMNVGENRGDGGSEFSDVLSRDASGADGGDAPAPGADGGDAPAPLCAFDIDGDGYVDVRCGGPDCDDENAEAHPDASETCDNASDDDCDAVIDEAGCEPGPGSCEAPIEVRASGSVSLPPSTGTNGASCGLAESAVSVVRLVLEERSSVRIRAVYADRGYGAQVRSGATCGEMVEGCLGSNLDAVVLEPDLDTGSYWFEFAWERSLGPLTVEFALGEVLAPSENTTCEEALEVPVSRTTLITDQFLVSTTALFYRFRLDEPRDVAATVYAREGFPDWSPYEAGQGARLFSGCPGTPEQTVLVELPNVETGSLAFERWSLPAGEYVVQITASPPYLYDLEFVFGPPTPILPGDRCDDPVALVEGVPFVGDFGGYRRRDGDVCATEALADWVGVFELEETRDVFVEMSGSGPRSSVGVGTGCVTSSRLATVPPDFVEPFCLALCLPELSVPSGACTAQKWRLPPGRYYVRAAGVGPFEVTLHTRAPATPVEVTGSDTCATARVVPVGRSRFSGRLERDGWTNDCFEIPGETLVLHDQLYRVDVAVRTRIRVALEFEYMAYPIQGVLVGADRMGSSCTDEPPTCTPLPSEFEVEPGTYYLVLSSREMPSYEIDFEVEPL